MHARYARFSQPHTEANFTKSGRTSGGARFPRARSWNGIFKKVDAFRFLGHRHNSKTCFCGSIMFRFFYCSRKKKFLPKNHRHPLNVSCCNIFGFFLPFSQPKCIPIDTSESWVISSSIITWHASVFTFLVFLFF